MIRTTAILFACTVWAASICSAAQTTLVMVPDGHSLPTYFPSDLATPLFEPTFAESLDTSLPFADQIPGTTTVGSPTDPTPGEVAYLDIYCDTTIPKNGTLGIRMTQSNAFGLGEIQFLGDGLDGLLKEWFSIETDYGLMNVQLEAQAEIMQPGFTLGSALPIPPYTTTDLLFLLAVGNPSGLDVDPSQPLARVTITSVTTDVPEPSSIALAALGLLSLGLFARYR
ncbi:MAG: PEP-CTERM sorting domain-containing protein [Planctomycetota bacterium]|nr:MAG: PEP-CTERM sorting domain-containing protein [Planctomycetota bacterium]